MHFSEGNGDNVSQFKKLETDEPDQTNSAVESTIHVTTTQTTER